MSELNIKIAAGSSVRLLTAGKQCDDIIVTVRGGSSEDASDIEAEWIKLVTQGRNSVTKLPDGLTKIGMYGLAHYSIAFTSFPESITSIASYGVYNCNNIVSLTLHDGITSIGNNAFTYCHALDNVTFQGTPTIGQNIFSGCTKLLTINVPWAEGEVANAPWGATNATINYNYTGLSA